jgi:Flp pilus assembly protein protease CpaA
VIGAAASILLLIACYDDVRHRRIHDWLPIVVVLFCQGWVGGGDVKLAGATVFLLGAPKALPLLLLTAIIGGIMAIGVLCSLRQSGARPALPYGVAIASAAIALIALDRHGWIT